VTHSAGQAQFARETSADGEFVRQQSHFRHCITADGSSGFRAEAGRYHLYVSLACPWAHRTIIVRKLKGLEDAISLSVVDPVRDERGWAFREGPGHGPDPVNDFEYLSEAYLATDPSFDGRVTVPVLWDRVTGRIVCNESSEIIVMLNSEFDEWGDPSVDLYPAELRPEIDEINDHVYANVNNGVYRAGFATTQRAYERAFDRLFEALDTLEERLSARRYLVGDRITLADWRLFTTLVRFDPVYVGHFKCNLRRIVDYPSLYGYLRELYQVPGVAETVNFDHIKRHYYMTHDRINPTRIVPKGPEIDLDGPHGRERLPAAR
jgi:putative glutathione S-transferase